MMKGTGGKEGTATGGAIQGTWSDLEIALRDLYFRIVHWQPIIGPQIEV